MTLAKVAQHAGVSTATASLILNGQEEGRFRAETRKRVLSSAGRGAATARSMALPIMFALASPSWARPARA